jgi:ferredoxin-NADP reductase
MTGSEFSNTLERLKIGDPVKIKMPLGSFGVDESVSKHAFLSGGIGITPIRSMLKDVLDRQLPLDMVLFYSNRSPEDIAFRSELEKMVEGHKNLKVIFSLDTFDVCPAGWKGRRGFINGGMVKEELPDYAERIFYVCGPSVMVTNLAAVLEGQLKIPGKKIKKENFAGY